MVKEILSTVLERVKPEKSELSLMKTLAKQVMTSLSKIGLRSRLGGSLAKGTLMKSNSKQDIDVFVLFSSPQEIKTFEKKIAKVKFNGGKLLSVHGSRDYFRIEYPEAFVELIPVLELPSQRENVTDFSLSHVRYVSSELKKNPKLLDDILLAKAFCKAQEVYGAESYIRGFSGYALEVLVIYFGSFMKFLKGVSKKTVIDPKKYYRNALEVQREINESKLHSPLIVVDPTHQYRNVTAGLGFETFEEFIIKSQSFLKKPSLDFFDRKEFDIQSLYKMAKKKRAVLVEINFETDRQEGDIAGTKMKKVLDFLHRELMRKGQKILFKKFLYEGCGQEAKGYLMVKEHKEIEMQGPSRGFSNAVIDFKKVHGKNAYLKGKFWYTHESVSLDEIFEKNKGTCQEIGAKIKWKRL